MKCDLCGRELPEHGHYVNMTDRQVRGRLLDVLRAAHAPVPPSALDPAWDDAVQRSRCLDSLLTDGLVEQTADGRFTLPG